MSPQTKAPGKSPSSILEKKPNQPTPQPNQPTTLNYQKNNQTTPPQNPKQTTTKNQNPTQILLNSYKLFALYFTAAVQNIMSYSKTSSVKGEEIPCKGQANRIQPVFVE